MAWKTFEVTLTEKRMITPSVLVLTFARADGEAFDYVAGQFINVHFEAAGQQIHRSYSIANPPGADCFEIAVSPVEGGRATRLFLNLEVGDKLDASGPYGRFVLREDEPCRYILAATGTGVTPYRAMLPELAQRVSDGFTIEILLGVWRRDEALFAGDFIDFAHAHEKVGFHACYSREMPAEPLAHEKSGYVQRHIETLRPDPARDIVYLCGNPNMIDEAVEMLRALEFPTKQLRREKYLPARI